LDLHRALQVALEARIRRLAEAKAEAFKQKTFDKAVEMLNERVKNVQAAR
jgi:hypothetical protein